VDFEAYEKFHPKYQRTRKMRIKQFVALADVFDVLVEYLLGSSNPQELENARNVLRKYGLIYSTTQLVSQYHARNAVFQQVC